MPSLDARKAETCFTLGRMDSETGEHSKHSAVGMPGGVPANWTPTKEQPVPVVRCTTIKKDGQRCRRFSIRGSTVCYRHGGSLPGVQERAQAIVDAARMRIVDDIDDALDTIEDLLKPGTAEAIRLKAAESLLDRAGIKGGFDLNVEVTHNGPDPAAMIRERLTRLTPTQAALPSAEEDIQDAEIVEDTLF